MIEADDLKTGQVFKKDVFEVTVTKIEKDVVTYNIHKSGHFVKFDSRYKDRFVEAVEEFEL